MYHGGRGASDSCVGCHPGEYVSFSPAPRTAYSKCRRRVGEVCELECSAEYGYGAAGKGPIPGGSKLWFRIDLLSVTKPKQQAMVTRAQLSEANETKEAEAAAKAEAAAEAEATGCVIANT